MPKKELAEFWQRLWGNLGQFSYFRAAQISKKKLQTVLQESGFRSGLSGLLARERYDCTEILEMCRPVLVQLCEEPMDVFLSGLYDILVERLFPSNPPKEQPVWFARGGLFFLIVLRTFLQQEKQTETFDPMSHFQFATAEEQQNSQTAQQYSVFLQRAEQDYIIELMRIGRDIKPFDLLGHVAGVHHIAMHTARQLVRLGIPVDLPLVSAAAAMHDIGKYGCKGSEQQRIPYLHYYYTEEWLKRYDLEGVAHIAANHSTWDLELENLPVESLLLIYADFRVKSQRKDSSKEQVLFYSLKESYDVILSKLDNVDDVKRKRYERVYAKLADFEAYIVSVGVNSDPYSDERKPSVRMDAVLLSAEEAVQGLKYQAISHNIRLMHKISSETSFVDLLEDARTETDWQNIRTYIDIFEEYFTYMTQKQKLLTMRFLYDLFMHTQGDIRYQAATLYGRMLSGYDAVYRKELPANIHIAPEEQTSFSIWQESLELILAPDHKIAPSHRAWISYTLKVILPSLLNSCKPADVDTYLRIYFSCFDDARFEDDSIEFVLLDSLLHVPSHMLTPEWLCVPLQVAKRLAALTEPRMQAAALRLALRVLELPNVRQNCISAVEDVLAALPAERDMAIVYLALQAYERLPGKEREHAQCVESLNDLDIADLFLENLKTATPWVMKEVNILLLLYRVYHEGQAHAFQVATHLANLIRVSERFAVRHRAGEALVRMAPLLTLDQRNEIAVEMSRGMESASYEFSKYIPQYLGQFVLYLHPKEFDEVLNELEHYIKSANAKAACVTLSTIGVLIQQYDVEYLLAFQEPRKSYEARKRRMLSMLLGGISHYSEAVSREAFLVLGKQIFGSALPHARKSELFCIMHKKLLMLIEEQSARTLTFFNNAASLNHIYRFIIDSQIRFGPFLFPSAQNIAFFPGTFDPFSASHLGIVNEIRNMGYEVYLALDEFSWSKKTQPHMTRRRIVNMSVADAFGVYLFPDDIPINLANPADMQTLKSLFPGREVHIAVGSDVIRNASAYKNPPTEHSIHSFGHIVFLRNMERDDWQQEREMVSSRVSGQIHELSLPPYLEDVSSSRIRENIDHNRDISTLVDPVAQAFIYDNGLYLREPQYKQLLLPETMYFQKYSPIRESVRKQLFEMAILQNACCSNPMDVGQLTDDLSRRLQKPGAQLLALHDNHTQTAVRGIAVYYSTSADRLFDEFQNVTLAEYARRHTSGKIAVLAGIYVREGYDRENTVRFLLTETLAECLKQDYTYALCIGANSPHDDEFYHALERQGFIALPQTVKEAPVYAVDMRSPIAIIEDVQQRIKPPLYDDPEVSAVLQAAHKKFSLSMSKLYEGRLVLSFHAGMLNHALAKKIMQANHVDHIPHNVRQLGECMCVPYGKTLRGIMVPNTVTKTLHVDKTYEPDMKSFSITTYPGYSSLINQIRAIKSFNRPVLLVDDLLHKGYRLEALDPQFKQAGLDIKEIIVCILSGRGKDLMDIQGRHAESVYFIPNLRYWFVESMLYPFLGGDSVRRPPSRATYLLPSINQIYPYTSMSFISGASRSGLFDLSLTCLLNSLEILRTLERRHQVMFGCNLTLNRLGEATVTPRVPDRGGKLWYDRILSPSVYVETDIEMLLRLENQLK